MGFQPLSDLLRIRKQTFSNFIKNKLINRLNDVSLDTCLKYKTINYSPDVNELCSEIKAHEFH